tara:strand:+ start:806 stop:1060 length:255 start_codon:yes stop_codon:yes gene_type:complete
MSNNKLVDKLILIIKNDMNVYKHLLNKKYDEREEVDVDVTEDQYGNEVVDVDAYHIDLKIEYLQGSIGVSKHIMELIKENTDNL